MKKGSDLDDKGNIEASWFQIYLEEVFNNSQEHLMEALQRNKELERDLFRSREELKKSLKLTTSSQILLNQTSQVSIIVEVLAIRYNSNL